MKRGFLVLFSLFIVGCGGADSIPKSKDIKSLVEGKTYYEEDLCKDPEYTSYSIKNKKLTVKTYSDVKYSDSVTKDVYPILKFEGDDMEIRKDGDTLSCTVSYEVTDKKRVTMLGLDCVDASNTDATNELFFIAYDTKKSAHLNRNKCK